MEIDIETYRCADCANPIEPGPYTILGHPCVTQSPGYAIGTDGKRVCIPCAEKREREAFKTATRYTAYVASDGMAITTWTGAVLATVVSRKPCALTRVSYMHGRSMWRYSAVTSDGVRWYGRGSPGIVIKLRRAKPPRSKLERK